MSGDRPVYRGGMAAVSLRRRAAAVYFLPATLVDGDAPTPAEIAAGIELTEFFTTISQGFAARDVLDPRYEWIEIVSLAGVAEWVRGRCRHLDVVPVESLAGEVVAHLCLTCDAQLPEERQV